MTNIDDYLKYFEEFGFEDPEFFKSGHAIQQCQAYLLEQIMAGVTPEDLIVSETNFPELNRTEYVGGSISWLPLRCHLVALELWTSTTGQRSMTSSARLLSIIIWMPFP